MFSLAGKCAVVVGGTSGIGKAIALGLASAGANVVASSRSKQAVETIARCLEKRGSKTLCIPSDVLDRSSLQHLHDAVLAAFGQVDILVNSAGITKRVPTLDCSEELWQSIMNVNLNGTLRACQIFGATMLQAKKRQDHQHRVALHLCRLSRGRRLRRQQGRRRRSHPFASSRMGCARYLRQRHRPRHLPHRSQSRTPRLPTRQRTRRQNADGPLWYRGGGRRHSPLPRLRRKCLYNRTNHRSRRRFSRQWS